MDEKLKEMERTLEKRKVEDEIVTEDLSIAQKKAAIKEAKSRYGRDWKKILGFAKGIKPDMEVVHTLYGMGMGSDLRDLNDPRKGFRRA